MRLRSLTAAVYIRMLLVLIALGSAAGGIAYVMARANVDRASDGSLRVSANMLYALMQEELSESADAHVPDSLLSAEDKLAFRTGARQRMFAVFRNGTEIVRSENAPPGGGIPRDPGFHTFGREGWRSYGMDIPRHGLLIVVGERRADIDRGFTNLIYDIVFPVELLVLFCVFLLWTMLRDGLSDMRRLNRQLDCRSFHDLDPLDPAQWSRELGGLIGTLNTLFERVRSGIEQEQAFTDAAAHQLRTPLAAIRMHAELLGRTVGLPHARMLPLLQSIDQARALTDRMLLLARLDATTASRTRFDVADLVAALLARQALLAARSGIAFSFDSDGPAIVDSDPALLETALSALVENAMIHAAAGGIVEIRLGTLRRNTARLLRIDISDRGPGIPEDSRTDVFRRFHQVGGAPGVGTGLGLAIAARAVERIGGRIELSGRDDGPGLMASILMPCMSP
ncbi:sensor histidine kinase [Gluconacetobacter sacchari]|uniref:histidine kinase n=2 Tax=Gluconacetobacter sacchari TaxID=92759 RepID=A0A7W4NQA6_9PROT|nr:HAMP domain-containing sensor histidine kinase [Gluconacetobacter sacchari]MBB2159763.1 HAMP domain-containing histidine kinase [Gluconacetobacter sacchari]GBQ23493.1 integral membrane sensor signal transduction histidine kinase [Gluconacetobacter sacchari DSM 12717]